MKFDLYSHNTNGDLVFVTHKEYRQKHHNSCFTTWVKQRYSVQPTTNEYILPIGTSFIHINDAATPITVSEDAIGAVALENILYSAANKTALFSLWYKIKHKFCIIVTKRYFAELMTAFGIQRASTRIADCFDDQDIFCPPTTDELPLDFVSSCVIYALFDTKNLTCQVRSQKHKAINHFFPFSHTDFIQGTYTLHLRNILSKAKVTCTSTWLAQHAPYITGDAAEVLNIGKNIYQLFFDAYQHIDLRAIQLHHDDASPGWYQIRTGLSGPGLPPAVQNQFKWFMKHMQKKQRALARTIVDSAYKYGFLLATIGASTAASADTKEPT